VLSADQFFARRLAWNSADASDLVQETSLRALENADKFVDGSVNDLKRWLWTVMRNLHFDRSLKRRREVPSPLLEDLVAANDKVPCQRWRVVDDRALEEAVSSLPQRLRVPYALFVNDRLSYVGIARSPGIPENTVGTRIGRARKHLRAVLSREGETAALGGLAGRGIQPQREARGRRSRSGDRQGRPLDVSVQNLLAPDSTSACEPALEGHELPSSMSPTTSSAPMLASRCREQVPRGNAALLTHRSGDEDCLAREVRFH